MKSIEEVKKILKENKEYIREKYGVVIIGIFGSFARGEQTEVSDVDILVEIERPLGFEYFDLWDELESLLSCKVDLLTVGAAKQKPLLWESIEEDLAYV
ncbi:MAG: nucleotidyltransferase family protein [Thermodesulfovibrio sp.]|nr:nucleotidyltransferase family protein [Thermodesulfovibrio sp.]MDW7973119.1 nucleotidyltransferase family protein [Thermodesulfovibrio sp.]